MFNMYFEKVSENKSEMETKGFDYFINTDIDDNSVVSISTFIKDKHFHFSELVDNFNIALNAIKSYNTNHSANNVTADEAYTVSINREENTIFITIFDLDFDVDILIQSYTYALGYLQSCMINCYAGNKGGEINA